MWSRFLLTAVVSGAALASSSAQITLLSPATVPDHRGRPVEATGYPDFPPLPRTEVSLIGGVVTKVDPVRDRLVVHAFGGRDLTIAYDVRTNFVNGTTPV